MCRHLERERANALSSLQQTGVHTLQITASRDSSKTQDRVVRRRSTVHQEVLRQLYQPIHQPFQDLTKGWTDAKREQQSIDR